MHFLDTLLAFITHHPGPAYGAIFLISLSESLALVGLLIPGTVIMFGVGAVVAAGSLGLVPVLLLAAAGAVSGDGISYWLGRHYRESLKEIWPFSRYPAIMRKGMAFFDRHGGKSVLFGRFVGPVRPVIPVVAGMMGMTPLHFGVVNVLSAVGWALVYILPGVFFGASLAVAGAVSTRLAVLVFILVAGIWGFIRLCRRAVSTLERRWPAWLSALGKWAGADASGHVWSRPVKRFVSFLLFKGPGEELLLIFLALVLFAAGWGFLGVLQDVLARDPLVVADQSVYHFFQSLRTPWADSVFVAITELGDSFVNLSVACAVLGVLLFRRCHRTAVYWAATVLGGMLGIQLLKWATHLPRPVALYHGASAYAFPSGHATMSVILYGFLAILLARRLAGTWRWTLFSCVVLFSFVIGLSRLYLGAHWLSDVLGGLLVGTCWAAVLGIAYLKGPAEILPRRWLGIAAVTAIAVAGGWQVAQRHGRDLAFYAPQRTVKTVSAASWRNGAWRGLPAWRIDLEGEPEQPLTVQWAGSPGVLGRFLKKGGWQPPPAPSLKRFLAMFASHTPVEALPVLPQLHDGRTERLLLVRTERAGRLVLRLWPADVTISGQTLFIGTVEQQRRRQFAGLITMAKESGGYERPLKAIEKPLERHFSVKRVFRADHGRRIGRTDRRLLWRGDVLLIWKNAAGRGDSIDETDNG